VATDPLSDPLLGFIPFYQLIEDNLPNQNLQVVENNSELLIELHFSKACEYDFFCRYLKARIEQGLKA